jgi:hypothetical protein
MSKKNPPVVEFLYELLDNQNILLRPFVKFHLPDLEGEFDIVPNDQFERDTFIDISPRTLLVPSTRTGIDDGPYVMAAVRPGSYGRFKLDMLLLEWLHEGPQEAFVVFGEGDPEGEWDYLSHDSAEKIYQDLLPHSLGRWALLTD